MNLFKRTILAFFILGSLVFTQTTLAATSIVVDPTPTPCIANTTGSVGSNCIMINQKELGFSIPNFSDILTFAIRAFFIIAGLAALLFLLLGAFSWITSGGEKDKVGEAQKKIQAAVVGLIMIIVALSLVITLEQVVFSGKICFGLSCPITIPTLLRDANAPPRPATGGPFQLIDPNPVVTSKVTPKVTPKAAAPTSTPVDNSRNHLYNVTPSR